MKFDTACSRNMSGVEGRIRRSFGSVKDVAIRGFNGSISYVNDMGQNEDGRMEYFVKDMRSDMVLLSAQDYAKEGAAVLFGTYGVVLRLSDEEKKEFEAYVKELSERNRVLKNLVVHERTYEVAHYSDSFQSIEEAYDSTATRYFNSKVNVSNADERILAMLLTGLTFNDLYSMAKTGNVEGLPRDMTIQSLKNFATRYGNTPDIFQMAIPNLAGNTKGYFAPKVDLQDVGDRVEADIFQCDFNEKMYEKEVTIARTQKLPTLGGAIAAFIPLMFTLVTCMVTL